MAEGNAFDLGSIYGLLVEVAKTVSRHDTVLDRHSVMLDRIGSVLEQHGSRLTALEANMATKADLAGMPTRADFADLRQTVTAYHSSVLGQGIMVSELEERVRRIERHLDLPPFVHG